MRILFINGVNLCNLGKRDGYGDFTLDSLKTELAAYCDKLGADSEFFTSNHEGEIVERLIKGGFDGLVINAGAHSHYSLAIADALTDVKVPKIEAHLTNIHARNRHQSVTGAACDGVISGLSIDSYRLAVDALISLSRSNVAEVTESIQTPAEVKAKSKFAMIGMMGTGKTEVGMRLAEKMGVSFADIDNIIVYKVGMPISQVFIYFGEKTFRSYETSALSEVIWHDNILISCGGGVTLNEENMDMMRDFVKIRLTADADTIYERTKHDMTRPLLRDNSPKTIAKLIEEREEEYAKYADITVDTVNKTVDQVADEAYRLLIERGFFKA